MVKALEYCSLRQAVNWIDTRQKPLPEHIEQMLRGQSEPTVNHYKDKPAHPELLELILCGRIRAIGILGSVTSLETIFDRFEFVPDNDEPTAATDIMAQAALNYADFEHNCIYKLPHIEYANGVPIHCTGLPVPALGNIQVFFADLLRLFPVEPETAGINNAHIEYRGCTIYISTNDRPQKFKTLRMGNQRAVFEYLYEHPGQRISDAELAKKVSLPHTWTKDDSIAQIIINIFPDTALRKALFPILSRHEAMFMNGPSTH